MNLIYISCTCWVHISSYYPLCVLKNLLLYLNIATSCKIRVKKFLKVIILCTASCVWGPLSDRVVISTPCSSIVRLVCNLLSVKHWLLSHIQSKVNNIQQKKQDFGVGGVCKVASCTCQHTWSVPRTTALFETLIIGQLFSNFSSFMDYWKFITVLTKAHHWPLSDTFTHQSFKTVLLLSSCLCDCLPTDSFPSSFCDCSFVSSVRSVCQINLIVPIRST
jgi:hypothetical protein